MKAIVWTAYGPPDVLQLQEVDKPFPKDNEVLIKVHAASVNLGDCELRKSQITPLLWLPMRLVVGITRPKRITNLGQELAGVIESVGKNVKRFKKGDQVFASTGGGMNAYTEYRCLREDGAVALKPANMTYEEAAAVPVGGLNAMHFLKKANIQSGQKVLINGAGGSIGTAGIQLARSYGAEVTAVDSVSKLDMLRELGADKVIDYAEEDFTENGEIYDVIFEVVGKAPSSRCLRSLKKNGFLLLANSGIVAPKFRRLWTSLTSSKNVRSDLAGDNTEDLAVLKELIEAGKIRSFIDRRYPLEQIAEAHRYVETGEKKGNVIITVAKSS